MSIPVKRIEKDYYLKALFVDQIPAIHISGHTQYVLYAIEKPEKGKMVFKVDRPILGLSVNQKIDLMFDYYGDIISFTVEVLKLRNNYIITSEAEFVRKNLERSFLRVDPPSGLQVLFEFNETGYSFPYPMVSNFEDEGFTELIDTMKPQNLQGVIKQIAKWINGFSSGHKILLFKKSKPSCIEERILVETGKSLYLPSTLGALPTEDPYPIERIITENMFKEYLKNIGVAASEIDVSYDNFIKSKKIKGLLSDLWVPILFQKYVVGYAHIWVKNYEEAVPFSYETIDNLYKYINVLAHSLKVNGRFDFAKESSEPFAFMGDIVDISASGLLFTCPDPDIALKLLPGIQLSIQLNTKLRTIKTPAKIMRRIMDSTPVNFGCTFQNMEGDDLRFLFEFIYGKNLPNEVKAILAKNL